MGTDPIPVAPTLPGEAAIDPDLVIGAAVGEYVVEGKLGQGGFGAVFKASHPVIGKLVAIKVLSQRFSVDKEMLSRFVAEARAVNQIRHRNIIDIFAFGQLPAPDSRHYYVMELIEGEPLDRRIARGPMTLAEALPILRGIAQALDAAHAKGIAHRDLKAENVFLGKDSDGSVDRVWPKLLDFGIAKLMGPDSSAATAHKTRTGAPMGTPLYMSPEQSKGRDVDHRTDHYAFGVLAYVMLTGEFPIDGEDFMTILMRQVHDEPVPASQHVPGLPKAVDDALAWLMRKDPAERPPTLMTAVDALEDVVEEAPKQARPRVVTPERLVTGATAPSKSSPPAVGLAATQFSTTPQRSRGPLVIGAVVGLGVAIALGLFAMRGGKAAATPDATVATNAPPPADATPVVADAATIADAALSPNVTVTLDGVPGNAEVRLAGQLVGTGARALVPRGDREVPLVISADGFVPTTILVTPDDDLRRPVTLKPRKVVPRGNPGSGSAKPTDDIDTFPK